MDFERESAAQAVAARELAHDLGLVSATVASHWVSEFDSALADWIDAYGIATSPPFQRGRSLPGLDETPADLRLTHTLQAAKGQERIYAWARLWRVGDALRRGFGFSLTGPCLGEHVAAVKQTTNLKTSDIAALIPFFDGIWQDGALFEELWEQFKPAYTIVEDREGHRDQALDFFVKLIATQWFFRSFRDIRRVLERVRPPDNTCLRHLANFRPDPLHGSGVFAGYVIRALGFDVANRKPGQRISEVLAWFSDSASKTPSRSWYARKARLEAELPVRSLNEIANWVCRHPELRYFGEKPYRDDLYWRVWKSAAWCLGKAP